MTHDYKAALEWFNRANWNERVPEIHAIRHALLIADRVMGEPSDELALMPFENQSRLKMVERKRIFKAMRDQLIKEVTENG